MNIWLWRDDQCHGNSDVIFDLVRKREGHGGGLGEADEAFFRQLEETLCSLVLLGT